MRKWIILVVVVVGLLIVWALWYFRPWDPIGPVGYSRLRLGMTEQEITEILGQPDVEHRSSPAVFTSRTPHSHIQPATRAGAPSTSAYAGTSCVTTAPAATKA